MKRNEPVLRDGETIEECIERVTKENIADKLKEFGYKMPDKLPERPEGATKLKVNKDGTMEWE